MAKWDVKPAAMTPADVTALIRRLGNPPFGTETSERNLMAQAAAALTAQTARAEAAEAQVADLTAKLLQAADALAASIERSKRDMALIVKCTADMQATIKENADLTAKLGAMRAALRDPIAVHANMMRGAIAMPSVANIIHLYGADTLRAAIASLGGGE